MFPLTTLLAATAFVTPVFGLSLEFNPPSALASTATISMLAPRPTEPTAEQPATSEPGPVRPTAAPSDDDAAYSRALRQRTDIAKIHRIFGVSTWVAMTASLALGFVQFYNLYGFGAGQGGNPCVTGSAIFGQDQCVGRPLAHQIATYTTAGLYFTTFTLSFFMPDPDDSDQGNSAFAEKLRTHKMLRWVHLGGMIAQLTLGILMASGAFGINRAENYGAMEALAGVHMGIGLVTWGALTWAGALMTF